MDPRFVDWFSVPGEIVAEYNRGQRAGKLALFDKTVVFEYLKEGTSHWTRAGFEDYQVEYLGCKKCGKL